jgi:site-specific recombinase XerC
MTYMSELDTVPSATLKEGELMGELAQLAETYLRSRARRGELGMVTIGNQRSVLQQLTATYGDRPVANFRRLHIEKWLETRGHLKASTRRCHLSMIRGFTAWLVREGHVKRDPSIGIKPPRQPRSVPRVMPTRDIGCLLRSVPDARARAIVALGVGCGLRCCEIARLCVEDWDRDAGALFVTGKGGHERVLPVPKMVLRHLRNYLVEYPASVGPLIRSYANPSDALQAKTISKMAGAWMNEAGVKLHPFDGVSAHALRHTAATDVYKQCKDLRVVQEMLGHQNLATTAIYLGRAGIPKMRKAMEGRTYQALPNKQETS